MREFGRNSRSAVVVAITSLVSVWALAQDAGSPAGLPPDPGSVPIRARVRHYVIRGGVTPRVPSARAIDPSAIAAARAALSTTPPDRWSCTRLRGEPIDPELASRLPGGLRDGCFYEGYETISASAPDESTGLTRVHGGGFVPSTSLERRRVRSDFHGASLVGRALPTSIARLEDSVVFDAQAATLEGVRPVVAPPEAFLRTVTEAERWVYVDRDDQVLVAFVGRSPVMITLVSTGRGGFSTEVGEYRVSRMQETGSMRDYDPGRGDEPYYIAGVPYIQYFNGGQAFHGVFWHDRFGGRASHGCVNLALADAQWLFDFVGALPTGDAALGRPVGAVTSPPAAWPQGREGVGPRVFIHAASGVSAARR